MKNWGLTLWFSLIINSLANAAPYIVQLKGLSLDMNELVLEATKQCDVTISIEESFPPGPKIYYDCSVPLDQVLEALKGYVHFHTGKKLIEVWSEKTVSLAQPRRQKQPKQNTPVDNPFQKRSLKPLPIMATLKNMWLKAKGQKKRHRHNRRQQENHSAPQSTKVKKMKLNSELTHQVSLPEGPNHTPIMVETVPRSNFKALDLFPNAFPQHKTKGVARSTGANSNNRPLQHSQSGANPIKSRPDKSISNHDLPDL